MDNKENLARYVDSFIKDDNTDSLDLSTFIKNKAKEIVSGIRGETVLEFDNSAIKFHGDEIMVSGKLVGSIKNDLDNLEEDINFVPVKGSPKKFKNIEELYSFLATEYKIIN